MQTIKDSIKTIAVSLITLSLISIAYAWTEPISTPPADNASIPVNTSKTGQIKDGGFWVGRDAGAITEGGGMGLIVENGNVGIGTTAPGAKLEVVGQVKITGGVPGVNKVLKSDASGLASWADLPASSDSQTLSLSGNTLSISGGNSQTFTGWDTNASDDVTSLTAGTGISISGTGDTRTITNSVSQIIEQTCSSSSCTATAQCGTGLIIVASATQYGNDSYVTESSCWGSSLCSKTGPVSCGGIVKCSAKVKIVCSI